MNPKQKKQLSEFKYYPVENRPHLFLAKGMLTAKEYGLLYSLGRSYRSEGLILDLGSFCGASAFCLGMGLMDSDVSLKFDRPLHCFDLFVHDNNPNIRNYINRFFYSYLSPGALELTSRNLQVKNFRQIFNFQTSYVSQFLQVHEGSLFDFDLNLLDSQKLEIINVDLGKSQALNNFIIKSFYPKLIEQGYIFQQDILIAVHWYLLYSMFLLKDYLILKFCQQGAGWLFQVVEKIPDLQVDKCIKNLQDLDEKRILDDYQNCLAWIPNELHLTVNLCFAYCMIEKFGIGNFKNLNALLDHFNISIDAAPSRRIKQLCLKQNLLTGTSQS